MSLPVIWHPWESPDVTPPGGCGRILILRAFLGELWTDGGYYSGGRFVDSGGVPFAGVVAWSLGARLR